MVTDGPGYALRAEAVDAWRFEHAVATRLPAKDALAELETALAWWRGPAYAEFAGEDWARAERSRLTELRLHAVERVAEARLALGLAAEAVPPLDAHVAEHPWREEGWRLLALALYRSGRQGDALAVLRRARTLLIDQLGVDPGPALRALQDDILHHEGTAEAGVGQVWAQTAAAYDRVVASGARARLEATVGLLRELAVTGGGGLEAARGQRAAAIAAAEELGDPLLTARVIGAYDVPAIWTRADDPAQAAWIAAAAERTLAALDDTTHEVARARLLATIALESRGVSGPRGPEAARQAEAIARRLDDPALLAFALNGTFMQTFARAGLAPRRDAIGAELIALATRHDLVSSEILGHLIRLQARSALGDFAAADHHAAAADQLDERHERPLVAVFTRWYRALRLAATEAAPFDAVEAAYRDAAKGMDGAGMPGLEHGLLPLALLCARVQRGLPAVADADWGPYEPWARPHVLLASERRRPRGRRAAQRPRPSARSLARSPLVPHRERRHRARRPANDAACRDPSGTGRRRARRRRQRVAQRRPRGRLPAAIEVVSDRAGDRSWPACRPPPEGADRPGAPSARAGPRPAPSARGRRDRAARSRAGRAARRRARGRRTSARARRPARCLPARRRHSRHR